MLLTVSMEETSHQKLEVFKKNKNKTHVTQSILVKVTMMTDKVKDRSDRD